MQPPYVSIGLIDPKSPSNVGAVMRAAGCYQVDAVRHTGSRYTRAARFHTDTQNISRQIPLISVDDILTDLPAGISLVCVELVEGALALPAFKHPDRALYVFGPEDGSLGQELVDRADFVVYIPTQGSVAVSARPRRRPVWCRTRREE